jgi:hypothetical protein
VNHEPYLPAIRHVPGRPCPQHVARATDRGHGVPLRHPPGQEYRMWNLPFPLPRGLAISEFCDEMRLKYTM